ncbi:MAG: hypothetical protein OEV00_13935, partial [Acidobacteriota bacterium]|nr:hypothetical protein [Acidobacteriota bacterium]
MASTVLKAILRIMGTSALTAWIFVAAPYAWMNRINEMLGMGTLPDTPVVGYLARSNSALYAMLGGLFWVLSLDLPRYRPVLSYLGVGMGLLGAARLA